MASARNASLNGGLGAEPPTGSSAPGGGGSGDSGGKPPEAESFLYIFIQKWPKVKDLSENLSPCLSRAAMTSPKFWSLGAARSAHSWIRHWSLKLIGTTFVYECMEQ